MKSGRHFGRGRQALLGLMLVCGVALAFVELTPNIPNIFNANESAFQNQTHFLVFTGSDTPGENAVTATAYYNAIDPGHTKLSFPQWLKNAGFIGDVSQWHPTGPQIIACDLGTAEGCDVPAHNPDGSPVYGDNIINTDSHAIVLNAADLGFIRNQFVRCIPSCTASNPIIYTYLENYPVNPFAASGNGGSGFPFKTGYPTTNEAAAAMSSALNRPSGTLAGCDPTKTDTPFGCKISRIADVAFEWSPPPNNPTSSGRYGKLYAYVFQDGNPPTELIAQPGSGGSSPNVATRTLQPFNGLASTGVSGINVTAGGTGYTSAPTVTLLGGGGSGATAVATIRSGIVTSVTLTNVGTGYTSAPDVSFAGGGGSGAAATASLVNSYTGTIADPFAPNLDFIGSKQHPGVCFICHGGDPVKLTSTGVYPNQGNVSGFRFLPLDIRNLLFSSDSAGEQPALNGSVAYTDRAHQELQIKRYNQAVLATVSKGKENDGTGSTRVAHVREVIIGWYAGYDGDQTMSSNVQNGFWTQTYGRDFIPQGWLESQDGGTAPPGSEALYLTTIGPFCRSCHFNREVSLDFGTAANLKQPSDILQLALLPYCNSSKPPKGAKAMPLAHLTYQKYWQANFAASSGSPITLPYPAQPPLTLADSQGAGPADQIAKYFLITNDPQP